MLEGLLANYPEHFGQDKSFPELLEALKIDTLKVAVELSKSPQQKAAAAIKKMKLEQEKEEKKKQMAIEYAKFQDDKRAAAEEAEQKKPKFSKEPVDEDDDKDKDDGLEQELKEVEESLSRRESTSSVEKHKSYLVIESAVEESLKRTALNKIELLKMQIRILREKVVRLTKTKEDKRYCC